MFNVNILTIINISYVFDSMQITRVILLSVSLVSLDPSVSGFTKLVGFYKEMSSLCGEFNG